MVIIAAATFLLAACAKEEPLAPSPAILSEALSPALSTDPVSETRDMPCLDADVPLLDKKWTLRTLYARRISLAAGATRPYLKFSNHPDRVISGSTGCNELAGGYSASCESLEFENINSTRMYCANTADLEQLFLAALRETDTFEIRGATLLLLNGDTELAALNNLQMTTDSPNDPSSDGGSPTPPYIPVEHN